jgi:hypothetical protein
MSTPTKREPIPVGILQFPSMEPQEGPGISVATAITARGCASGSGGAHSRHDIEFHPWLRAFRVVYTPPESNPPQPPIVTFIPEHRVTCWYPLVQPTAAAAPKR